MQKFFVIILVAIFFFVALLQGFEPIYNIPNAGDVIGAGNEGAQIDPQKAVDDIYFNISTFGIEEATPERLKYDYNIDESLYTELYGKYSNGKYGVADLIIMRPAPHKDKEVLEALQTIQLTRLNFFKNYDIYNAYDITTNGSVEEIGDYYVLIMMENKDEALSILRNAL